MSADAKAQSPLGAPAGMYGPFPVPMSFSSRRSPVLCRNGAVSSSQPLATAIGVRVLQEGGNAADAAVAVAAALNVTEPCSTGIGGDCFAIYFDAASGRVEGLNGSGRCPAALTRDRARADCGGLDALPESHAHSVTVPGAAAGWADAVARWGRRPLADALAPAIRLAEEGFPLAPLAAVQFHAGEALLSEQARRAGQDEVPFLPGGKAPKAGQVVRNPELAATMRRLAEGGPEAFYGAGSETARAVVETLRSLGSLMTHDDLEAHRTDFPDPVSVNYRGVDVWEMPPNGQGITALIALNILEGLEESVAGASRDGRRPDAGGVAGHNTVEHLHAAIEAMRLAFADTRWYVADPQKESVPTAELLSKAYAARRRALVDPARATADVRRGSPTSSSDTVQFVVVDGDGNACSFINSNYSGFGSGIVARGCGFTLQSRGANFSLVEGHPNALAGGKRPYHTIIPGLCTRDGKLHCAFGVMGGFNQPQGHMQVVCNMVDFGMDPQQALDRPRFCIRDGTSGGVVCLEEGIPEEVVRRLADMGHRVEVVRGVGRSVFGRGQIIWRDPDSGVLWCGSDPRADGCAMGW